MGGVEKQIFTTTAPESYVFLRFFQTPLDIYRSYIIIIIWKHTKHECNSIIIIMIFIIITIRYYLLSQLVDLLKSRFS